MLYYFLLLWARGFLSHSSTHLYFSGVMAVNWGKIYILSARSMTSCPLSVGHGFGYSLVEGYEILQDLLGKEWVGQQWDGSNFYPFELVLKVISKGIKGEQEHDFVGRKSQRRC